MVKSDSDTKNPMPFSFYTVCDAQVDGTVIVVKAHLCEVAPLFISFVENRTLSISAESFGHFQCDPWAMLSRA